MPSQVVLGEATSQADLREGPGSKHRAQDHREGQLLEGRAWSEPQLHLSPRDRAQHKAGTQETGRTPAWIPAPAREGSAAAGPGRGSEPLAEPT